MVMRKGLKHAKIKPKFGRMKDFFSNMYEKNHLELTEALKSGKNKVLMTVMLVLLLVWMKFIQILVSWQFTKFPE